MSGPQRPLIRGEKMANEGNREQHREAGRKGGMSGSRMQKSEAGRKGAEARWGREGR